ncbi:MmcQ/YjbR family DNA-binding protein [Cellulomonas sp. P22]|uniref:MmcQ/YjbR family DNA-binding protein n=1 Tax=Cellulomonas sp. P22 TaxID=3373189 RepID=UPI003789DD67
MRLRSRTSATVDPHHGDALRRDHDSITPGRYLDKNHWISVGAGRGVTKRLIDDLVHSSYELAAGRSAPDYRSS